ncbi:saccharopine dehydrogenase family protein [Halosimplex salinum]|uniref:saccharopine dehydrogenase family protein n=1 Tax=Halosimplex salinum TaxID=1710538 RepID=UPI000F46ED25|nr:saccharopine dehydrogenase NADP-binding domain-containing protein [Halosimplex salinum]
MADLLVYGSYGYTGRLVVEEATGRDLDVVVAGRDRNAVENQAIRQKCEERVFDLDEPRLLDLALEEVDAVLNCAGPFEDTAEPVVDGCLRTGTHYLDITGEIPVFERLAIRDEDAEEAGITVLPGVGFDVVPTDCLAAHLADRLPDAERLSLGFQASGGMSPGTARTALRGLGDGGAVRREGRIESVPTAWRTRRIDFGDGERSAMTIPWGDVATAYHTTGIGSIEVYTAAPGWAIRAARLGRYLGPLAGSGAVRSLLESVIDSRIDGPSERERREARNYVWGEVESEDGERAVSRLVTPEAYRLTKLSAVEIAERVVDGDAPEGFQTPAGAFGPDLILDVEGVERSDDPIDARDAS